MPTPTACDACKLRKVKCDMTDPCANCRISELRCAYTILPRRRGRKIGRRAVAGQEKRYPEATSTSTETGSGPITTLRNNAQSPESPRRPEGRSSSPPTPCPPGPVPPASMLNPDPGKELAIEICRAAAQIREDLTTAVKSAVPSDTIVDVIHRCIDLFAQYLFPVTPIMHEPTLRAGVSVFGPESRPEFWGLPQPTSSPQPSSPQTSPLKAFTLITALCASVASVMPDSLLAQRQLLSNIFLKASRAMHRLYEDYDLEYPDSSSLAIRIWHSTALQNITGMVGGSWHCVWEAALIAQRLRLYDEESMSHKSVIESQLLRASFWQLYAADKAACAFENRPYVMNEMLFSGDLTLLQSGEHDEPLLDVNKSFNKGSLESRLYVGFHLKRQFWARGGDLILEINTYSWQKRRGGMDPGAEESALARLTESFLAFTAIVDDLPPWLHDFYDDDDTTDAEILTYQRTCFRVQRCNLMTTFHCLRLVILQKCIDNNVLAIAGLDNRGLSFAMKKLEIVHDFLQELQTVPFICFKVLGEAAVERIRRVGAILLELTETAEHDALTSRSTALFKRMLDFLVKLDSRASDTMNNA